MEKKELSVFPTGNTNDAFTQCFVGQSYLNMLSTEQVVIGNVPTSGVSGRSGRI